MEQAREKVLHYLFDVEDVSRPRVVVLIEVGNIGFEVDARTVFAKFEVHRRDPSGGRKSRIYEQGVSVDAHNTRDHFLTAAVHVASSRRRSR